MNFNQTCLVFLVLSIPILMVNQSFGQVTWKTFNETDGLFSIQIPSNWFPERIPESEKLAPIDYLFRYADKGDSFVWLELLISNSQYYEARDAAEAYISGYSQYDDFQVLEPVECNTYMLNNVPACSFLTSFKLEGEEQRSVLSLISITSEGIQNEVVFVASSDVYDAFFPVGNFIINSLTINSSKVNEALDISTNSILQNELPPIPSPSSSNNP